MSPKALVRTSGNRLYVGVSTCAAFYPCTGTAETLRMYKANSTGIPSGFTRLDSAHEPSGLATWAVALDGSGVIHVVFTTRTAAGGDLTALKYTTFDTATDTWSGTVTTIAALACTSIGQGDQTVAIALDAAGAPHIVYLDGLTNNRRTYYRNRVGGSWSSATRIDDGVSYTSDLKAWHPNLAFDTSGRILAVWLRGSLNTINDGTIYSRVRSVAGAWGTTVNLSGDNAARTIIDQSTSILITPDGRYHVAWIAQPNDYIRYAFSDDTGATWTANNPGGGTQASHNPSLGQDGAGGIRIYGHGTPSPIPDGHGDNLYYFSGPGGTGAWSSFTLYVTGSYDSSVNTRWSQFFHHFPSTLDVAYWGGNDDLYVGSEITPP